MESIQSEISITQEDQSNKNKTTCSNLQEYYSMSSLQINSITKLDISSSHFVTLPEEIFEFKNLRNLDLSDNQLTSISKRISEFKHLEKLNLFNNNLYDLPSEMSQLQ